MSYATMDHAAWVTENFFSTNTGARRKSPQQDRGWATAPHQLSPFHEKVFDILGIAFNGIYNAPIRWHSISWKFGGGILIPLSPHHSLSTFDFTELTTLVFLSHEARIRLSVSADTRNALLLGFHQRLTDGAPSLRHPSLDEATAAIRRYVPATSRIFTPANSSPPPTRPASAPEGSSAAD